MFMPLVILQEFQSTLSLRRATQYMDVVDVNKLAISIHALLAESDLNPFDYCTLIVNFNPRSPCGERRTWRNMDMCSA